MINWRKGRSIKKFTNGGPTKLQKGWIMGGGEEKIQPTIRDAGQVESGGKTPLLKDRTARWFTQKNTPGAEKKTF